VQMRRDNVVLFADVQKSLQISILSFRCCRLCSPLFAWVGVKLVSTSIYSARTSQRYPFTALCFLEVREK
jgi:hypothetical protein